MITRFDRMYERDSRQTDGQTPHDRIGRACIALRGKKYNVARKFVSQRKPSGMGCRRGRRQWAWGKDGIMFIHSLVGGSLALYYIHRYK